MFSLASPTIPWVKPSVPWVTPTFRGLHPRLLRLRHFVAFALHYSFSVGYTHCPWVTPTVRGLLPRFPWVTPTVIEITPLRGFYSSLLLFRGLHPLSVGYSHVFRGLHPRLLRLRHFVAGTGPYSFSAGFSQSY